MPGIHPKIKLLKELIAAAQEYDQVTEAAITMGISSAEHEDAKEVFIVKVLEIAEKAEELLEV